MPEKALPYRSQRNRLRAKSAARSAAAAAISTALVAATPNTAGAASESVARNPDLVDRVMALRQTLAEKDPAKGSETQWIDRAMAPGTKVAQWNKWKNG